MPKPILSAEATWETCVKELYVLYVNKSDYLFIASHDIRIELV